MDDYLSAKLKIIRLQVPREQQVSLWQGCYSMHFRAAMKMANIDASLDFMFTNPRDIHGASS